MKTGILLKRYGGFYYVYSENDDKVYECMYRGKHRIKSGDIYPGDYAEFFYKTDNNKGIIEKFLPRKNLLTRPSVANVTQVICVVALKFPNPNLQLIDRLLVIAESFSLNAVICFNKKDLVHLNDFENILNAYRDLGYQLIVTSAKKSEGIDDLNKTLIDNVSVLAGQSGVGKSSLLNAINPDLNLKVGEISRKLKTGRHVTKHVELIKLPQGGFVADTPGFSKVNLDLRRLKREDVTHCFPELSEISAKCKFSDCFHKNEPGCAVIEAVNAGEVFESRYKNYLTILEEVINGERRF